MGNVLDSFGSGLGKVIGNVFHAPIDFLSGKSCSSVCAPLWDVACYIENFCVANLLKLALMLVMVYMVLLFIYLTYKLKVFHCLICCVFKAVCACFSACFYACSYSCHCFLEVLSGARRRRRRARMGHVDPNEGYGLVGSGSESFVHGDSSSLKLRKRRRRRSGHSIRRSLRPRSHRVRVGVRRVHGRRSRRHRGSMDCNDHGVRVTRTSRFAHKAGASRFSGRLK